ncbi:MAG: DNA-deoxyinosine glycosylase [Akkermansia sp.]
MTKKSFQPVVAHGAKLLILGSLPGDASLAQQEYYAYKHNVFWRIMGSMLHFDPTCTYQERLRHLTDHGIALWDVLGAGERLGSLDSNIRGEIPNDIPGLLRDYSDIKTICCNGGASYRFLKKHFPSLFDEGRAIYQMPSTSPAAASIKYEQKREAYRKVLQPIITP